MFWLSMVCSLGLGTASHVESRLPGTLPESFVPFTHAVSWESLTLVGNKTLRVVDTIVRARSHDQWPSAGSTAASTLLRASDACKEKFCGLKTEVGLTLELVETLCESRLVRSHKS